MKAYNKLLHNLKENFYNEGFQQTIAQLLTWLVIDVNRDS